jgi:hypothetical protein
MMRTLDRNEAVMTFRFRHTEERSGKLGLSRSELQNHVLYNALRGIAARVMCDVYGLNVDNCDKIPQEAIDYRENLLEAMVSTVVVHEKEKDK